MIRIAARCRDSVRRNRTHALCPSLENLEDRKLLATLTGTQWPHSSVITYSFMPDGTSIGGTPSNLFQKLDAIAPTATWQAQFQKAAAIWQKVAGINLAQVSDSGLPLGGTGNQQGDSRYGDIRIGGTDMSMGWLGYSLLPPPVNGGPHAGDIVINTSQLWKINNDYDLLTVAIHEIGHSLGLGHSADLGAAMYQTYLSMKQDVLPDDIDGIQAIYGPTQADATANTSTSTAIDLTPLLDGEGRLTYDTGYVTSLSNFEYYKVTVPSTTNGTMTVKMQSTNLSSLSPRLTVLNSNGMALAQGIAVRKYGATVTVTISNVSANQTYYFISSAAQNGPGSNGAFGLQVNFNTSELPPIAPPDTATAQESDQGSGSLAESVKFNPDRHPQARRGHRRGLGRGDRHGDSYEPSFVIRLGKTLAYVEPLEATLGRFPRPSRFRRRAW